jgi:hypothetical protein
MNAIFFSGHAADDVAATYGENLPATLSAYIKRIPHPAPRAVELTAQRQKSGRAIFARPVERLRSKKATAGSDPFPLRGTGESNRATRGARCRAVSCRWTSHRLPGGLINHRSSAVNLRLVAACYFLQRLPQTRMARLAVLPCLVPMPLLQL